MPTLINAKTLNSFLAQLNLPEENSHKGDNGKLLIIGGSQLFHAASRWSLEVASKLVDMVFYASIPENNKLIQEAKQNFWNGIVISRSTIENYIQEADCVLIGPGMERDEVDPNYQQQPTSFYLANPPSESDWSLKTQKVVNYLLAKYPAKKWVIDAGALQMMDGRLLNENCIITPHSQELARLLTSLNLDSSALVTNKLDNLSDQLNQATVLLKGPIDSIIHRGQVYKIAGGNPGLTKGGTGDVLAGLLAGLYATNDLLPVAIIASYVNKTAGDLLHQTNGPFYNATDLVEAIPQVLWKLIKKTDENLKTQK